MRQELDEKSQAIDKLKRDIKLSRMAEMESEVQSYMEES